MLSSIEKKQLLFAACGKIVRINVKFGKEITTPTGTAPSKGEKMSFDSKYRAILGFHVTSSFSKTKKYQSL